MVVTVTSASAAVRCFKCERATSRTVMPIIAARTATITRIITTVRARLRKRSFRRGSSVWSVSAIATTLTSIAPGPLLRLIVPMGDAEHDWHEEERRKRRKYQPADDRSPQWRVLLAT